VEKATPVVRVVSPTPLATLAPAPPERPAGGALLADLREQMKRRG
jgi:hypothetical protein